ncbi:hypothetical protein [Streptomyces sp. NPDC048419]|uniref:hypothetical protein n=1 Tax=Streptomyces sp. NPDC048419 TaxID=3365547 RepID=UPI0037153160
MITMARSDTPKDDAHQEMGASLAHAGIGTILATVSEKASSRDHITALLDVVSALRCEGVPGMDDLCDRLIERHDEESFRTLRPELEAAARRAIKAADEARAARDAYTRIAAGDKDAQAMLHIIRDHCCPERPH